VATLKSSLLPQRVSEKRRFNPPNPLKKGE
jgi:hypothetical protein